mmetsp:Transcript_95776/g.298291  ORF Transcript_95776/g.298291 Transcript_95776/m.298291 type:complete len:203 (-) Transcript_95776:210-818(-)
MALRNCARRTAKSFGAAPSPPSKPPPSCMPSGDDGRSSSASRSSSSMSEAPPRAAPPAAGSWRLLLELGCSASPSVASRLGAEQRPEAPGPSTSLSSCCMRYPLRLPCIGADIVTPESRKRPITWWKRRGSLRFISSSLKKPSERAISLFAQSQRRRRRCFCRMAPLTGAPSSRSSQNRASADAASGAAPSARRSSAGSMAP